MRFTLEHMDAAARAARLETRRGVIETPVFMPVGTVGTVKAVLPRELVEDIKAPIILGNTYHLFLRPGTDIIRQAGGLHRFMAWPRPILTDSGGYQVYSLAKRRTLTAEGVTFRSHIDGTAHTFTPESVVDIQRALGSDFMMVLDECPPADCDRAYAHTACDRTVRWAERCLARLKETEPLYEGEQDLFAIVQGVVYPELRRDCARRLLEMDFPGYAIGGLSVGESAEAMYSTVEVTTNELPVDKPRYLMGVGTPANILEAVARGVDMFDCVLPTRNGRNGMIFTTEGILNIKNRRWRRDYSALDPGLDGYVSTSFSKAYVRHLFLAREILGLQIASIQNLSFYIWLMRTARKAILESRFAAFKTEMLPRVSHRL